MGEKTFLPTGQEHCVELQSLGGMEGHQVDLVCRIGLLNLHHQGDVFQIACEVLKMLHGADEFLQIVQATWCIR